MRFSVVGSTLKLTVVGLVVVAGCATPFGSAETDLRVVSYNIRYGTADDGGDSWPLRRELALRVIDELRPDVVGMQEALRFQLDAIGSTFPHFGEIGVGRDDGAEAGEYAPILFDRRRLEPLEQGTFWLSDTPDVAGSTSWGNRITRITTWARFRDRRTARTFYVFNAHWDHQSQPSRERSAELLLARIEDRFHQEDPVLVTGDFNAGETNPAFERLLAAGLADTFRDRHPNARDVGTFHAFRGDRSGEKIDAVLVSAGWSVVAAWIVGRNEDGRYPSDHFPVAAVLR